MARRFSPVHPRQDWTRVVFATSFGALAFGSTLLAEATSPSAGRPAPWLLLDLALGAAAIALLSLRRQFPLLIGVAIALLTAGSVTASGALIVALVSLCRRQRWPYVLTVAALSVAAGTWWERTFGADQMVWYLSLITQLCSMIGLLIVGYAVRTWDRHGRPPLFGEIWRVLVAAAMAGVALLLLSPPALVDASGQDVLFGFLPSWWWQIDVALLMIAAPMVLLRRRWPLTTFGIVAAIAVISASSVGALLVVFISICTRRHWRQMTGTATIVLLTMVAADLLMRGVPGSAEEWITLAIIYLLAVAVCLTIGLYIGSRRDYIAALRSRAETAEREQASRVAQARANERARIAREMHDVLAHRISLIAMHAGALEYRADLPADQVKEVAGLLRDNADRAVQELRTVLGVLRAVDADQAGDEPLRPQPTLEAVAALISEAEASGTGVALDRSGLATDPPSETTSRTAYRIVQESLTNARKHAPGAPVTVVLAGGVEDGLSVEIRTPAVTPVATNRTGSGMGLVGLTERAVLAGGRFSYGVDRANRFVVRAWLPWSV